jgi:2'-hydroxyisoflavone reductase
VHLLVIGGTRFVGRHVVAGALERGWDVTVFHRGTTPNPHPAAREILGDRRTDLDRLDGRWDAVVDLCGYLPGEVAASADALWKRAGQYAFVSSVSVYPDAGPERVAEDAPRKTLDAPVDEFTPALYGELKAACEDAVLQRCGPDALIVRPGLIVGSWDHTDRFGYWVRRIARGGVVLAPGDGAFRPHFIDARDVATFVLDAVAARRGGTYNVQGPEDPPTFAGLLAEMARTSGAKPDIRWTGEEFLTAAGVQPWTEMPLWAPGHTLLDRVVCDAAIAAGLRFTPLATTLRDTLIWETEHGKRGASLAPERETELLAELFLSP